MKYGIETLDDFEVKGKTVLCRADMNSPMKEGKTGLADTTRIERSVPTIKELMERGAKTVLMTHQGGDLAYQNYYSTTYHVDVLTHLLGRKVQFIDDVCGPAAREKIANLKQSEILLLDNVRFMAEEMTLFETKVNLPPEEQAKTQVVKKLSPLAGLYVCDAFAAVHRDQPTLVGFERILPSAMGRLFEEEYTVLSEIMEDTQHPCVFVLGGAKIQDAFMMMSSVLESNIADTVLTGGLVGHVMLKSKGYDLGKGTEKFLKDNNLLELIEKAAEILDKFDSRVKLPEDLAYAREGLREEVEVNKLPVDNNLADIGATTAAEYTARIQDARTVFINGPLGVFEKDCSSLGTREIWEETAKSDAFSVIGGGDSITAVNRYNLADDISYICTAGGGLVRFLSGEELPVIKALQGAG